MTDPGDTDSKLCADLSAVPPIFAYAFGLYKSLWAGIEQRLVDSYRGKNIAMEPECVALLPARIQEALLGKNGELCGFFDWLMNNRETTNYTYDISEICREYLASFVSLIANVGFSQARGYIRELDENEALRSHIRKVIESSNLKFSADADARYARRLGWYALARATKPKILIETGLDKGLGACVLTAALMENEKDGSPGRYIGIDIVRGAGELFCGQYREYGELIYGDSVQVLTNLNCAIDMIITDSSHSAGYETTEYDAVMNKLSERAVVVSDASYDELANFAKATGRSFLFWPEWTTSGWYRGNGSAVAYR